MKNISIINSTIISIFILCNTTSFANNLDLQIQGDVSYNEETSKPLYNQYKQTKHNHSDNTESINYGEYFKLIDAFVLSDFEIVKTEAQAMYKTISSNKIKQLLKEIYSSENIDSARIVLSALSDEYIILAKKNKAGLYIIHCPMALNNKGANWLSNEKEIRNPYFGKRMLSCGKVTGKTNE